MLPTISIITPTFNAARYLEQTFASVEAQQFQNLEYIVVDGGSTDATIDIIKANEGLVSLWISEADDGISDAFNKGIRLATGDIIGIINADDYYHPGALDAVALNAQEYPEYDVYYGDAIHERFDGSGVFRFRPANTIDLHIWRRMPISHPATFVRRMAYERFGLFDTSYRLAMDYELVLRLFRNGARFRYVDAVLSHFRYGQDRGFSGLRELRDIAVKNGLSPFTANINYFIACLKTQSRKLLPISSVK